MKRFRFIEDGLCCDVFYSKEKSVNACALFLYGFPATIGPNQLTEYLVEKGYTVLQPHYYGTYDSIGEFTPASAVTTVEAINRIIKKGEVINLKTEKTISIPNRITICIGYSFGAYVLKHSRGFFNDLETILLFSPIMSNNENNDTFWTSEDGLDNLNYVIRTRPFTYRIKNNESWLESYVKDPNIEPTSMIDSVKSVLWVYGSKDDEIIPSLIYEKYKVITQKYLGKSAKSTLICVDNGEHKIATLLTIAVKEYLDKILK